MISFRVTHLVLAGQSLVFQLLLQPGSLTVAGVKVQRTASIIVGLRALEEGEREREGGGGGGGATAVTAPLEQLAVRTFPNRRLICALRL